MAQLTASRLFNALKGLFSSLDSTDDEMLKDIVWRKTAVGYFTDGGTAATAQTATAFWINDTGVTMKVTSVKISVPVAVTGHASNNATITLAHRTSAGASATTVVSFATDTPTTDDLVALASKDLTSLITAGNDVVPVGGVLTIAASKAGMGVALAAATSQAYVVVQLEPV